MKFFSAKTAGVALLISYSASMSVSCFAYAETTLSSVWLDQQINKHPDIVSARELINAEFGDLGQVEANYRSVIRKQQYLIQASTASLISNKKYLGR
jgi:hypothetical protein